MPNQILSVDAVADQLLVLGVRPGHVLLVHTAFSRIGPMDWDRWG